MENKLTKINNCYRETIIFNNNYYDFLINPKTECLYFFYEGKEELLINDTSPFYLPLLNLYNKIIKLSGDEIYLKSNNENDNSSFILKKANNRTLKMTFKIDEKSKHVSLSMNKDDILCSEFLSLFISIIGIFNNYNSFNEDKDKERKLNKRKK
jgi:hypothetical protein